MAVRRLCSDTPAYRLRLAEVKRAAGQTTRRLASGWQIDSISGLARQFRGTAHPSRPRQSPPMTAAKRRFVLRGLVGVNVLVLLIALASSFWPQVLRFRFRYSIAEAQWILLSFWAVLGTNRVAIRAPGWLLGSLCLGLQMWRASYWGLSQYGIDLLAFQLILDGLTIDFGAATAVILGLWLKGLHLVLFTDRIESRGPIWPQFSLKRMLLLTGAAAALMGFGNFLRTNPISPSPLVWCSVQAVASASLTCAVIWAALSCAPSACRVMLANLAAILVALLVAYYLQFPVSALPGMLLGAFIKAIWLTGSLLAIRACGYRALWPSDWAWTAAMSDQVESAPSA
jgi:hypothetical protein